jgi:hypothetical protein
MMMKRGRGSTGKEKAKRMKVIIKEEKEQNQRSG